MPIYKPSELRQFLNELGISPKKVLSQNFLIDGNIIRKIAAEAKVQPGDLVVEIGPGPGSLTEALLEAGAHVIAIEKDDTLANALNRLSSSKGTLEVFCDDVMQFSIEEHLRKRLASGQKAKLIANLPYHLTTPILSHFVPLHDLFSHCVVMVQYEVARRFTAIPGTSEYSSYTLFLNFYSTPKYAFSVSKHCFYPEPSVESAVVNLTLKEPPAISTAPFFQMTRTAFSHRRKMLRGSLRDLYTSEAVTEALVALGLSPQTRPEELSLEQWLHLFHQLTS